MADRKINNLDEIKSLITRRGGIARGNRYGVHITHPIKGNPYLVQPKYADGENFIGNPHQDPPKAVMRDDSEQDVSFIQDGRDTYILCTNVALPGKLITTTEATHNHNLAKKPYSMATDEVSMTFLITNDWYIKKYFDIWMELIIDSTGHHYKTRYKKDYCADVQIQALFGYGKKYENWKNGIVGYGCKLENAYPRQISQVELGNEQEGLVQVTVTWEYDNWRMTDIEEGFQNREKPAPILGHSALPKLERGV